MSDRRMRWSVPRLAPTQRAALAAVTLAAVAGAPRQATAEDKNRAADVILHRTHADVLVMASFTNTGEPWSNELSVPLADGFLTDLAMSFGPFDGAPGPWRRAALTERVAASQAFTAAFEGAPTSQVNAALLDYESPYTGRLQLVIGRQQKTNVAYKLVVPIDERIGGRCLLTLGALVDGPGMAHVRLGEDLVKLGAKLDVDGVVAIDGATSVDATTSHDVWFDAPTTEPVSGDAAVLPIGANAEGADEVIADVWFDTATRLGEVPEGAHVVVVVDRSRSLDAPTADALGTAARGYLEHFDARRGEVAVVAFDRRVSTLRNTRAPDVDHAFMSPADARATLASLPSSGLANGSNLDAALVEAGRLLAPLTGPKRVVVLSDLETAARIDPAALAAPGASKLPAGTVLHVVRVGGAAGAQLHRDDESPWAALARSTGGLTWGAMAGLDHKNDAAVFEELARPMRIDLARMTPRIGEDGSDETRTRDLGSLDEGLRFHDAAVRAPVGATFTIEGEVWSTRVTRTIQGTAGYRELAAGRVFTSRSQSGDVAPDRLKDVALLAHALSPVTSFVFVEGAGPSFSEVGDRGTGGLRGSHRTKPPVVRMGVAHDEVDADRLLEALLRPIAQACAGGAAPMGVRVIVETTGVEIVEVRVEGAPSAEISGCMEEGAWAADLDPAFARFGHRSWRTAL